MEEAKSDAAIDATTEKDGDSKGLGVGHGAREIIGMEAVEDHDCHGCGLWPKEAGKDLVWRC
uniref:Uncharacterized protein n=1 Tax=Fagus sylvatica TaxID=28930 RepID=A0A2N9HUH1_FAGSY